MKKLEKPNWQKKTREEEKVLARVNRRFLEILLFFIH
jgi:hypothetical protein